MIRIRLIAAVVIALSLLGLRAQPSLAAGICPGSESDVQYAISVAGNGDTVTLSCSSPKTVNFGGSGGIGVGKRVTLDASSSPAPITFDGGGNSPLFQVNGGGNLTLRALTLQNGSTSGLAVQPGRPFGGGAILVDYDGTLNIDHSTLSNNAAPASANPNGGAIWNEGSLTITNSTFTGNSADNGGGAGGAIYTYGPSAVNITSATFSGNSANEGGAITITSEYDLGKPTVTIARSTFSNNTFTGSSSMGGALFVNEGANLTVSTSTFSGNSADQGGVLFNQSATVAITSSTLSGNSATTGGAVDTWANTALGGTIVAGNAGGNCNAANGGTLTDEGYNLEDSSPSTCGFSTNNHDVIGKDPRLGPLANNLSNTQTMALQFGSPAIDVIPTGTSGLCSASGTDERGNPRPDDNESFCDIGAFEWTDICPSNETELALFIAAFAPAPGSTVPLICNTPQTIYFDTANGHTGTGSPITVSQNVTLDASSSPAPITFDGGATSQGGGAQLFVVNSGTTLTLKNLTMQNGYANPQGGAIYNSGVLNVVNSTLANNFTHDYGQGGAIYNNGGTVNLTNSTLSGNFSSTDRYGNQATSGDGGAIYNNGGTVISIDSTMTGNSAGLGSAVEMSGGHAVFVASTIAYNIALDSGAIDNGGATVAFAGSILADNGTFNCTTFNGSTVSYGHNLEDLSPSTCNFNLVFKTDIVGKNPLLGFLTDNGGPTQTVALQRGSPAIDAVPTSALALLFGNTEIPDCGATDQRGSTRPDGNESTCDMGAYETAYTPAVTITGQPPAFSNSTSAAFDFSGSSGGAASLTFTCTLDNGTPTSCTSPQSYSHLTDGSHAFVVTATDGTTSSSAQATWTVDTATPVVTITPSSQPGNPTSSTSASFAWTSSDASDSITGYTCQLDSGTATTCTSPQLYSSLSNGSHTFTVTATDQAGNSGSDTYKWVVDAAPPFISITSPADNATYSLDETGNGFTFTCSDPYDQITSCAGSLSGTGISGSTAVKSGDAIPTSLAGNFALTVNAKDQAGNTNQQQVSYTVTNPAPSLASLSPASVTAGTTGFTLKVFGSGFICKVSQVQWNGTALTGASYLKAGTPVSTAGGLADEIDVPIPSADLATTNAALVTVVNPAPGGGTTAPQAFFVTPAAATVTASSVATSTSSTGTATAEVGGTVPGTAGSVTAAGSGQGTVAVAGYSANPETSAPPTPVNAYFDVYAPSGSAFSGVTITDCNLAGGTALYYWSASAWQPVPDQSWSAGPPACVTATVTNIGILAGTPIAASIARPTANPVITAGTPGTNGWYRSNVTVTWHWSELPGPGTDPTHCPATTTSSGQGTLTLTASCQDRATTTGTARYTVKVDTTPPTITASLSPAHPASSGWYNRATGAPTVRFSCSDATSGIAGSCPAAYTFPEGTNESHAVTVWDKAGNSSAATASGIKVDLTAPVVTYSGNTGSYTVDQTVSITCSAGDPEHNGIASGLASTTCQSISGPAYSFGLGSHTVSASATDKAGNVGSGSTSYSVRVTSGSLCILTQRFFTNQTVATSLCTLLSKGNFTGYIALVHAYGANTQLIAAAHAAILIQLAQAL